MKKVLNKFCTLEQEQVVGREFLSAAELLEDTLRFLPDGLLLLGDLGLPGLLAQARDHLVVITEFLLAGDELLVLLVRRLLGLDELLVGLSASSRDLSAFR